VEGDRGLIQIVDAAMAEAARKSGAWLACRPGCCECCIGPFPITPLDAGRLRRGLEELDAHDPDRASRIRARAGNAVRRLSLAYPGDTIGRLLAEDDAGENEPCPVLDPDTKTCDLYAARPVTCRTFGPAVRFDGESLAVCELCYQGATAQQIAACEVEVDPDGVESQLLAQLAAGEETIVAFALVGQTADRKKR
jgi:Fe-S-cluster containining protein